MMQNPIKTFARLAAVFAITPAVTLAAPVWAQADVLEDGMDVAEEFPEYTFACPDGGYETGCDAFDVENAIAIEGVDASAFADRCLYTTEADCSVIANGQVNRADAAPLHWQILGLQPLDGPYIEMIVLAEIDGPVPNVLLSQQVEGYFDPPVAVRDGDGRFLLHVPARNRRLGNADIMLYTSGMGWNWSSAQQIRADIDALLPKGFQTDNPIVFNLRENFAFAPVRRDDDPGCCATGGLVSVEFEQEDNALTVTRVGFLEMQPVGERRYAAPDEAS